mgnify:CR=1 FL=1
MTTVKSLGWIGGVRDSVHWVQFDEGGKEASGRERKLPVDAGRGSSRVLLG